MSGANFTISAVIKAVDKITAPVAAMTAKLHAMTAPVRRLGASLKSFSDNTGITKLAGAIANLGKMAAMAAAKVVALGGALFGLAGVGAGAGLLAITKGFADAGDEAITTATKLGIATNDLIKMRFAADMLDVSQETLDASMGKMNRSILMASKGAKDQVKALQLLGYTDKQIRSGKISVADATERLAARMEDERKAKTNGLIANALYGKSYQDMLPMLKSGKQAIADLQAEAERLGLTLSDDAKKAAEDFDNSTKLLNHSLKGLRNAIGSEVVPLIIPLVDRLKEWIVANRELVAGKVTEFVQGIAKALREIEWNKVIDAVQGLGRAIIWLTENMGFVKAAIIALIAAPFVPAIIAITTAFIALTAPMKAVALVLAGIITAAVYAWTQFDKLKEAAGGWGEAFKAVFIGLGAVIADTLIAPLQSVLKLIEKAYKLVGAEAPKWLRDSANFSFGDIYSDNLANKNGNPTARPLDTRALSQSATGKPEVNEAKANVTVDFRNAPQGTRVNSGVEGKGLDLGVDVGYQTGGSF